MKNHIAVTVQGTPNYEFVLSSEYITGIIELASSSETILKLNQKSEEVIFEHTDDATLQAEFVNNIKKALIAKPGFGKIKVQLPEGFEIDFAYYG